MPKKLSKLDAYKKKIIPLLDKISDVCEQYEISNMLAFHLDRDVENELDTVASSAAFSDDVPEQMILAYAVLIEDSFGETDIDEVDDFSQLQELLKGKALSENKNRKPVNGVMEFKPHRNKKKD